MTAIHEDNNINEILLSSIQEQINYHQASTVRLSKGLYLGYLKMQSSVDQIQIVVPSKTPNILPHYKIRDNAHISAEEWKFLKRRKLNGNSDTVSDDKPTAGQELFIDALTHASKRLFKYMDIPLEDAMTHRLYEFEVIELSSDVSFLIICPPAESSCAVPGQREILLQRGDLLSLPIQAFEMVHLKTYQSGIIQKYSRLSCILELDTVLANHSHREAFSTVEVQAAKERLAKLQDLTQSLNTIWKGVRWLMDVISFARDRGTYHGLYMKDIFEYNPSSKEELTVTRDPGNQQLLQPPPPRGSIKNVGRGSWPGPSHSLGANGLLGAEHSKSEQQLSGSSFNMSSRYLSATSGIESSSRKNSADSNFSHSGNSYYSAGESVEHINVRLPPSRSEDTLVLSKKHSTPLHRKRATTVNTNFTSDASSPVTPSKPLFTQKLSNESVPNLITDSDLVISRDSAMTTSTPISSTGSGGSSNLPKESNTNKKDDIKLFTEDPSIFKDQLHITEGDAAEPVRKSSPEYPSTNPFKVPAERKPSTPEKKKHSSPPRQPTAAADDEEDATSSNNMPGIIQVFAAYNTGLANGTSLKLHVTPKTTAREVVDLVVKQLNMAVVLKGKDGPIYAAEQFDNFCLVAVIGARERCLRDDFKPLQLQNPWKKGRLYVRQKNDLLAAIEHANREATLI